MKIQNRITALDSVNQKTFMQTVIAQLNEVGDPETGELVMQQVARAYVRKLKKGSFMHAKELIDRQEGRVPQRIADADGKPIKLYVGMPIDDDDEAP